MQQVEVLHPSESQDIFYEGQVVALNLQLHCILEELSCDSQMRFEHSSQSDYNHRNATKIACCAFYSRCPF